LIKIRRWLRRLFRRTPALSLEDIKARARNMTRQERVAVVRAAGWTRIPRRESELWRSPDGRACSLHTATVDALIAEQENQ
jgi:hypothetical protein